MAQQMVRFEQFFAAPRDRVFAYFADHEKFGRIWGGRFSRIQDGQDPREPNGLGSVRLIRTKGLRFEETIVKYEPGTLIEYTVSKGGPIKNHLGHIRFADVPGGTKMEYVITFEPRIPLTGGLLCSVMCASWHSGIGHAVKDITGG